MNRLKLETVAENEPVFANIEVTTRCDLRCRFCTRTTWGKEVTTKENRDMTTEVFRCILGLLPHAYRITLVGLGEPLLHSQIVNLVAEASAQGRRVGLVTNGASLDKPMSLALIQAGLHSIAFSLDAPNQLLADNVRAGSDIAQIIENIKYFIEIKKNYPSIFCAVSVQTVSFLEALMELVAGIGVDAVMLTDLNFEWNLSNSLWKNSNDHRSCPRF